MKIRDERNSMEKRQAAPLRHSWLTAIGAALVVLLIIGISIALFASRGTSTSSGLPTSATTPPPPGGQWVKVENRYLFSSLEAAPANPALVYACASPYPLPQGSSPPYTLLRSSDFGAHWQDLGKQAALRDFCQVTINPANGNDLYVVTAGTPTGNITPDALKHSTDGGKTWTTLQPKVQVDQPVTAAWHVQKLHMVGHNLYGIQWMSQLAYGSVQTLAAPPPTHLVQSSDDGKTWTAIDNALVPRTWAIHDFAVDPANPQTIYEIAGPLPRTGPPGIESGAETNTTRNTSRLTLYKTTDGGKNWQELLNDLLYASSLQVVSTKATTGQPSIVYLGETLTAQPLSDASLPTSKPQISSLSTRIRASVDGGANWHDAMQISGHGGFVHGWFAGPDGQLYVLTGTNSKTNAAALSVLSRYDPSSNKWSDITSPPQTGDLLAVTDTGAGKGAVLWLKSFVGGKTALYRYVIL